MKVWTVVATALVLCSVLNAEPTVWYVHPDSTLNSIQAALDTCADNDIVLVAPGTYVENIVWPNTPGIHMISETGPAATIIDGNNIGTVVWLSGSIIDTSTIIRGFTIRNGHGHSYAGYNWEGGGIWCNTSASPIIVNNIIKNNVADSMGGGILSNGASPIIRDNIINNNTAVWGGGVAQWFPNCRPVIVNNTINSNTALNYGGGIYTNYFANPFIDSCTVFDNYSQYGGSGIFAYYACSLTISNTTVTEGRTTISYNGAIEIMTNSYANITGSTISNNVHIGGVVCEDNCSLTMQQCNIIDHDYFAVWFRSGSTGRVNYCNISNNDDYGMINQTPSVLIDAENNWWGDATGPFHPDSNPGGLGNRVTNYIDFIPWLTQWGIEEAPIVKPVEHRDIIHATIFRGTLQLPKGKACRVFDIMGRVVKPEKMKPGIYFIEVNGKVASKVIKVR